MIKKQFVRCQLLAVGVTLRKFEPYLAAKALPVFTQPVILAEEGIQSGFVNNYFSLKDSTFEVEEITLTQGLSLLDSNFQENELLEDHSQLEEIFY